MSGHDQTTQLELELAALGELPGARVAELEAMGHADAIAALRDQNARFHELHDRDAMLTRIARRHEPRRTPMIDPRRAFAGQLLAATAALVALGAGYMTLFGVRYDRAEPHEDETTVTSVGGPRAPELGPTTGEAQDVPATNGRFVDGRPGCDTTRQWTAAERLAPDPNPPEELNAYTNSMLACLKAGVDRVVGMPVGEVYAPPRELVYACLQDFGFACASLGTLAAAGTMAFHDGYMDAATLRVSPDGRTWSWGERDTRSPRFGVVPDSRPITELPAGVTSMTGPPDVSCDTSRGWTNRERAAHHPESTMLASPYRRHMLTCLLEGLDQLELLNATADAPEDPLGHACAQDHGPSCAVIGAAMLVGRLAVVRNDRAREDTTGEDRATGARYMHRACALGYKPACNLLARQLDGDRWLREELNYVPSRYRAYGQTMFDGPVQDGEGDVYFLERLRGVE
jgi:hypothetical protein